jgi:hypothetical protein
VDKLPSIDKKAQTTSASQAIIFLFYHHQPALSYVFPVWIRTKMLVITPLNRSQLIPQEAALGISYPQFMGITYFPYPPVEADVDKLCKHFGENLAGFPPCLK